jgi:hypothetical protein
LTIVSDFLKLFVVFKHGDGERTPMTAHSVAPVNVVDISAHHIRVDDRRFDSQKCRKNIYGDWFYSARNNPLQDFYQILHYQQITERNSVILTHGCSHVGFVVDKVALGQVFSKYFGFPCISSFHQFLHNHPGLVQ